MNTLQQKVQSLSSFQRLPGDGYPAEALTAKLEAITELAQFANDHSLGNEMVDVMLTSESRLVCDTMREILSSSTLERAREAFELDRLLGCLVANQHPMGGVSSDAGEEVERELLRFVDDLIFASYLLQKVADCVAGAYYIASALRSCPHPALQEQLRSRLATEVEDHQWSFANKDRMGGLVEALDPDGEGALDILEAFLTSKSPSFHRNFEAAVLAALGRSSSELAQELLRHYSTEASFFGEWHVQHAIAMASEQHLTEEDEQRLRDLASGWLGHTAWVVAGYSTKNRVARFFKAWSLWSRQSKTLWDLRVRSAIALRKKDPEFAKRIFFEATRGGQQFERRSSFFAASSANYYLQKMVDATA